MAIFTYLKLKTNDIVILKSEKSIKRLLSKENKTDMNAIRFISMSFA